MYIRVACLMLLLLCAGLPALADQSSDDILALFEERNKVIAALMEDATVYVLVDTDNEVSMGTGFIVAKGTVLTNGHVIAEARKKKATIYVMNQKMSPTEASLVAVDYPNKEIYGNDFALLRFTPPTNLPILTFSSNAKRMDRVYAWGYPHLAVQFDQRLESLLQGEFKGAPPVVFTEGSINTVVEQKNQHTLIHSARISPGNSGGPLVNSRGEVVGINTWIASEDGALINAAQPTERILAFLARQGIRPTVNSSNAPLYTPSENMAEANPLHQPPALALPQGQPPVTAENEPENSGSAPLSSLLAAINSGANNSQNPIGQAEQGNSAGSNNGGAQENGLDIAAVQQQAEQGDAQAQGLLGMIYYSGTDTIQKDIQKAKYWFEKGVAQNDAQSMLGLGLLYISDTREQQRGVGLLKKAFANTATLEDKDNLPYLSLLVAMLYDAEHLGVPRDVKACAHFAQQAARLGDAEGMGYLAMLTFYGEGVKRDVDAARDLAQKASKNGSSRGKSILAWMHYLGLGVPEDDSIAFTLAREAAEEEDPSAQGLLSTMYYHGHGVEQSFSDSEGWARRAADQANEFGQYMLGRLYLTGNVVEKDPITAFAYFSLAAEKQHEEAMQQVEKMKKTMSKADLRKAEDIMKQIRKALGATG